MKLMDIFDVIFLLVAGALYHLVFPGIPIAGGMKPDVSLAILFILIILKKDFRLIILSAIILGVMTTMTSSLVDGAWINLVEKILTATLVYYFAKFINSKYNLEDTYPVLLISSLGAVISAFIFIIMTYIFGVMPGPIPVLLQKIIIPSAILNIGATYVLYVSFDYAYKAMES